MPLYTRVAQLDFNRTSKDNLAVFIFGVLSLFLPDQKRNLPKLIWVAVIYAILSLIFNQWNVLSISVMFQAFYALAGIVFFVQFFERHDQETLSYILNGMRAGAVVQSVLVICTHFNFNLYFYLVEFFAGPMKYEGGLGAIGSLGNTNLAGSYLALTALSFLNSKHKWALIPVLYALFLTKSYMGIGSFLAGAFYFYSLEIDFFKKWEMYAFAILAMAGLYFSGAKNGGSGRFAAWDQLFSKVDLSHFIFGKGPGWYADQRFSLLDNTFMIQEHNSFLTAFNFFGIIIFIILLPLFIKFLQQEDKHKTFSAILFAAFCNSFGHFTLHQSTVAIIVIVSAAICTGESNGIDLER